MTPLTACAWLVLGLAAAGPIARLPAQSEAGDVIKRQDSTTEATEGFVGVELESTLPASSVLPAVSVLPASSAALVPASTLVPLETTTPMETGTPLEPEPEPEEEEDDGRDWCANQQLDDENIAKEIWNDWGVGAYMDEKIAEVGEDSWLTTLANEVFPGEGDTRAFGCSQLDQGCFDSGLDCNEMKGEDFWLFTAVKNMHAVFEEADSNLVFEGLLSSLRVSSIVKDFSLPTEPNPEMNILGYISGAFTMLAGAAAFSHPSTRMFAGIVGGAAITASRASVENPNLIDAATLDTALETALEAVRGSLEDYLALAVGAEGDDYASLPYQDGDAESSITKMFHDGDFLIQGHPEEIFSESFKWLSRSLVSIGLDSAGYAVIGDKDTSETMCTSDNVSGTRGGRWFPDIEGGRCFKLYMPETRYGYGEAQWRTPDDEVFDKLEDDYGIELVAFYQAAYDCAKSGADAPDPDNLPTNGDLPTCFYKMKSYQGYNVNMGIDETDYMDTEDWP